MSAVLDFVEDVVEGVADAVGDVVEGVFDVVEDVVDHVVAPVMEAVGDVVEAAIDNPIATIAKIAAVATGQVYLLPAISAADTLAHGGDLGDALKSAAITYVAAEAVGSFGGSSGAAAPEAGFDAWAADGAADFAGAGAAVPEAGLDALATDGAADFAGSVAPEAGFDDFVAPEAVTPPPEIVAPPPEVVASTPAPEVVAPPPAPTSPLPAPEAVTTPDAPLSAPEAVAPPVAPSPLPATEAAVTPSAPLSTPEVVTPTATPTPTPTPVAPVATSPLPAAGATSTGALPSATTAASAVSKVPLSMRIGTSLGFEGVAANMAGNALIQGGLASASGGDFIKGALAGGAMGAYSPQELGGLVTESLSKAGIQIPAGSLALKAIGNTIYGTILNGGDLEKGITNAIAGYAGDKVATSSEVNSWLKDSGITGVAAASIRGGLAGGISSGIRGQDIVTGAVSGAGATAVSLLSQNYLEDKNMNPQTAAALSKAASTFAASKLSGATDYNAFVAATLAAGSASAATRAVRDINRIPVQDLGTQDVIRSSASVDDLQQQVLAQYPDATPPSGLQLAAAGDGSLSDAGNGIFRVEGSGAPIYSDSSAASGIKPPAGYALASSDDPVFNEATKYDENDRILPKSDGTYYDVTQNAWFKPSGEFDLSGVPNYSNLFDVPDLPSDVEIVGDRDWMSDAPVVATGSGSADSGATRYSTDSQGNLVITSDRPVNADPTVTGVGGTGGTGGTTSPLSSAVGSPSELVITSDRPVDTSPTVTGVGGDGDAGGNSGDQGTIEIVADRPIKDEPVTGTATTTTTTPPTTPPDPKLPPVSPPATQPTESSSMPSTGGGGLSMAKLDSSPQFLAGAQLYQKQDGLQPLHQLFSSLTPALAGVLASRGFSPQQQVEPEKAQTQSTELPANFEELAAQYGYKPETPKFFAGGGSTIENKNYVESSMPKFAASPSYLSAAPQSEVKSRLAALTQLAQGALKTSRPLGGLAQGGLPDKYAQAAPKGHKPEFITGLTGYYASGKGTGQSDDIPAMLHDGDYVIDADAVAALGDGSSKAGAHALSKFQSAVPHRDGGPIHGNPVAAKIADGEYVFPEAFVTALGGGDNKQGSKMLDAMREELREHKRSAPTSKIPPKAKSPLDYLKMAKG